MSATFPYSPLPVGSQSIRVLDLEPQTDPQRLAGTLRTICLSDSPKFTALSYVWGTETTAASQITVNGHQKVITQNCYNALVALRKLHGAFTIWVDAICINQQDDVEKNGQIRLMEDIYSWAQPVFVWLGDSTLQSDAAMDCLSLVPNTFQCLWLTNWAASTNFLTRWKAALYALMKAGWLIWRILTTWRGPRGKSSLKLSLGY
jgi:hypothetical protein